MKTTLRRDLSIALEHPGKLEFEERAICHFLVALERYRRTLLPHKALALQLELANRELMYFPPAENQVMADLHAQKLESGVFAWLGEAHWENILFVGDIGMEDLLRMAQTLLPAEYMMVDHTAWANGKEPLVTAILAEK